MLQLSPRAVSRFVVVALLAFGGSSLHRPLLLARASQPPADAPQPRPEPTAAAATPAYVLRATTFITPPATTCARHRRQPHRRRLNARSTSNGWPPSSAASGPTLSVFKRSTVCGDGSGGIDQANALGAMLDMSVCYAGNLDHQTDSHADRPHQYGTLILTRGPLTACWNTLLPRSNPTSEQRGLLHAVVDIHGTPFRVYNTHLHTAVADRAVQVPAVDALIGETAPAILIGDLNAQPTELRRWRRCRTACGTPGSSAARATASRIRRPPTRRPIAASTSASPRTTLW